MTRALVIPVAGNEDLASRIAQRLDADLGKMETRNFPDGETTFAWPPIQRGATSRSSAPWTGPTRSSCR
jgi:phosphoribosylpyrophosphate synthetase